MGNLCRKSLSIHLCRFPLSRREATKVNRQRSGHRRSIRVKNPAEESQGIREVGFPIGPLVAAGKLLVLMRNASLFQLASEFAIVFDQRIFAAAIKSNRREMIAIAEHGFKNRTVLRGTRVTLQRLLDETRHLIEVRDRGMAAYAAKCLRVLG